MNTSSKKGYSYFDLAEHNTAQKLMFVCVVAFGISLVFLFAFLPFMEFIFKVYLEGIVYNGNEIVASDTYNTSKEKMTHYLTLWAIDIYKNTPQEARYWFEPITSLFIPSTIFGVGLAIFVTSLLPSNIGFMKQKIEREIANMLTKIAFHQYNQIVEEEPKEISDQIINASLREIHTLSDRWKINIEDLKALRKALIWRNSNIFYKVLHINDGITMYMRFYFTVQYSNTVLGFVYIGAAVLIIIIGLRGLKFIPSTQPSLVFFALGLEFSLLITYAFTLMYGKQEDDNEMTSSEGVDGVSLLGSSKPVNSKEIENLLRVFIKSSNKS